MLVKRSHKALIKISKSCFRSFFGLLLAQANLYGADRHSNPQAVRAICGSVGYNTPNDYSIQLWPRAPREFRNTSGLRSVPATMQTRPDCTGFRSNTISLPVRQLTASLHRGVPHRVSAPLPYARIATGKSPRCVLERLKRYAQRLPGLRRCLDGNLGLNQLVHLLVRLFGIAILHPVRQSQPAIKVSATYFSLELNNIVGVWQSNCACRCSHLDAPEQKEHFGRVQNGHSGSLTNF